LERGVHFVGCSSAKEAILSVSGILSSAVFGIGAQLFQSRMQKVHAEFQQFGQDLQSGNLSAAPADFATLQAGFHLTRGGSQSR
jgi:hypothetical protein